MSAFWQGARSPWTRSALACAAFTGLLALSACGGGGSDSSDKSSSALPSSNGQAAVYVGTWLSGCVPSGDQGVRLESLVTKEAADQMKVSSRNLVYADTRCVGPLVNAIPRGYEVFKLMGTKTVDGKPVDKVIITGSGGDTKLLAYTNGQTLWLGDDDSVADSDGYPTALDTSVTLTRQ